MFKTIAFAAALLFCLQGWGQSKPAIPLLRKVFHDNVDKAQKAIDRLDKKEDRSFTAGGNEEVNLQVSYTLFNKIDDFQTDIEADSSLAGNDKVKFLRGLHEALVSFEQSYKRKEIKSFQLPDLLSAYQTAMELERKGSSILPVTQENDLEIGVILVKCFPFLKNAGVKESKDLLVLKACEKNPARIMPLLKDNPNISFADSLIKIVARTQQEDIYTYAQSGNTPIGRRIQRIDDPLVKTITQLANMNTGGTYTGRLYFPFLDNLSSGKITMEEISNSMEDEYKYYRLLVNTQIDYAERLRRRDTPMVMNVLTNMLRKKAVDDFINVINGLHDVADDKIRMKKVEPLNAKELYYLCVMGETDIYTSSYLKVYDRIFQRMKNPNSDSLLISVSFDHFKKFIKMAANFNTLNDFLKRMDKGNAEILMKAFASGLERTNSLEDAVDVADSYASISDQNLRKLILDEVQTNVTQLSKGNNKRGETIYDLLNTIFVSMDTTSNIDLSAKFGIPTIYNLNNSTLKDSAGRIIIQQFFYGDKDGIAVFNNFVGAYSNPNWKIVKKAEWVEVSSTKGTPVVIYSNKPLDETKNLDAEAQANLGEYLETKNLSPTVVIHRGHSYYVKATIDQLVSSAELVLLGSCGGYHNLHDVLEICPYAHIIASKQVGSGTINQPMIVAITETLRQGKNLNWPELWKSFGKQFKGNEMFDDYVPPHKNLGAIFIMAYNKLMDEATG
jgi:hypothetical protein